MQRSFFLLIVSVSLSVITQMVSSQVYINEFMQSNIDCIRDDLNDFPDSWVELYNKSDKDVDIKGWYISDKNNYEKGYKIPKSAVVPANGYLLIYCDKAETGLHTSFRLESGNGCNIYLFNASGEKVDEIKDFPKQPAPNIACGREGDGARDWVYFVTATPGKKNEGATSNILLPSPIFNIPGGVYKENIIVELSLPDDVPEGVVLSDIRYTIDGSEPTEKSVKYDKPLSITKSTSLRTKIVSNKYLTNRSVTNTYVIADREYTLPIVSVSIDPEYMFDEEFGIYVEGNDTWKKPNYEYDWRRPMNIEYFPFLESGSVFNQLEEIRISGGTSRRLYEHKSFIVYANKRFGEKRYNYQLFDEKPDQEIKSFMLRLSGNDFESTGFRDAAIQLFMGGKVDVDYQAYQPSVLFINGKYYGIQNIRERSNEDFVIANYNGLEDIDLVENWPGSGHALKVGDEVSFNELMTKASLPLDKVPFDELMEMVDTNEFMNYMILQVYVANTDFPASNVVMWRPRTAEGKWRFIVKDTDFGLNYSSYDHKSLDYNLDIFTLRSEPRIVFHRLINHEPFRKEFYSRFAIYMGDILHYNATSGIIDSIKTMLDKEIPYHKTRWNNHNKDRDYEWWLGAVERIKTWCYMRNDFMYQHLSDYLGLKGVVPMTVTIPDGLVEKASLTINNVVLNKPKFDGKYFKGEKVKIVLSGNEIAENIGWRVTAKVNNQVIVKEFNSKTMEYIIPENCTDIKIVLSENISSIQDIEGSYIELKVLDNRLHISGLKGPSTVSVYDTTGRLITESKTEDRFASIALQYKGILVVRINDGQQSYSEKIVNE